MLSVRMLNILRYLENNNQTTYKQIAQDLEIKERYIRYDIDKINDYFIYNKIPNIKKKSKGVIVFPENVEVSSLLNEEHFFYSVKERVSLITLILLFNHKNLKLNHLCNDFHVSRSTIKNDLIFIEERLHAYGIELYYEDSFDIRGYNKNIIDIMVQELYQYIYLFKEQGLQLNSFEQYTIKIINKVFINVDIRDIVEWVDCIFHVLGQKVNDQTYNWYVSNILVLVWYITHCEKLPLNVGFDVPNHLLKHQDHILELERIIDYQINHYYRGALIYLLDYADDNEGIYGKIDSLQIQSILFQLVERMSKELDIDFTEDNILINGLLKHMIPLIKRTVIKKNMDVEVDIDLPIDGIEVNRVLESVIKEIDILKDIQGKKEKLYLTIHFIGSLKRMKKSLNKRVLIICHHGYGSSIMLKEALSNEFQVKVIDIIPSYKLSTYLYLDNIDYIVSTLPLKNTYGKGCVMVNPILTDNDYYKLKKTGLKRKEIRLDYHSLYSHLSFLDEDDKSRVLKILQKELGHSELNFSKSVYRVSDLLQKGSIEVCNQGIDWQRAIKDSSNLLVNKGVVGCDYGLKIIEQIKKVGFYCVTDDYFALFHGESGRDVHYSGMSLIVNKQDIYFDHKKVNVIFCLASKDGKDQIPAMILLMRMMKKTNFLVKIKLADSPQDILDILKRCEREVVSGV